MSVAAVIVTYNGEKWIRKCIDSLLQSTISIEVIVVDNGSNDSTLEILSSYGNSLTLAHNNENLGFGQGNNLGISIAIAKNISYFLLLNQDAWVESNTIEELILQMEECKGFGVLSPIHLNGEGTKLDFDFSKYISSSNCPQLISDQFLGKLEKKIYPIQFVNAAAWLVSAECILKVGGFSPTFFHYYEDNNFIDRVFYHGFKVGIVPRVSIFHDREFRVAGSESYAKRELFLRKLKLRMSHPSKKNINIYSLVLMQFFSSGENLSLQGFKDLFWKIRIYYQIKRKVYKNKELTMVVGAHFLP